MSSTKPFVKPGDPLPDFLRSFWQRQVDAAEQETPDFRHPPLPLARIKKVMKSDPEVKMIAADAPILFCKACEIFIAEITARAFIVADSNKRRTLSRSDIAKALAKSDQFDFLIDIVPREEPFSTTGGTATTKKDRGVNREENEGHGMRTAAPPSAPSASHLEHSHSSTPHSSHSQPSNSTLDQLHSMLQHQHQQPSGDSDHVSGVQHSHSHTSHG